MAETEKLLAVLDLPEGEQYKWVLLESNAHDGLAKLCLADLAFRLRDEAAKESQSAWEQAVGEVKFHCCRDRADWQDMTGAYWFFSAAQPIHWIVAALIANTLHIHAPPPATVELKRLECLTCGKMRFFVWACYDWYGADMTCLRCGERFTSEEGRMERPFCRGWRKDSIRRAKKRWRKWQARKGAEDCDGG